MASIVIALIWERFVRVILPLLQNTFSSKIGLSFDHWKYSKQASQSSSGDSYLNCPSLAVLVFTIEARAFHQSDAFGGLLFPFVLVRLINIVLVGPF